MEAFSTAAQEKKAEWLDSARSLLDSRRYVYVSSEQCEVTLTETVKCDQLENYSRRIEESIAAQQRLLLRVTTRHEAEALLTDLSMNFTEKVHQYEAILETKTRDIDSLQAADDALMQQRLQKLVTQRRQQQRASTATADPAAHPEKPRRKKSFYLGGGDEDHDEMGLAAAAASLAATIPATSGGEPETERVASVGSLNSLHCDDEGEISSASASPSTVSLPSSAASTTTSAFPSPALTPATDDEDFLRSFGEPAVCVGDDVDSPTSVFDLPRFRLDLERSLSPAYHGKIYRAQLQHFDSHLGERGSGVSPATGEEADIVQLWWACERDLPHCAYQILSFTEPGRRRTLANASRTAEASYGPFHVACRRGNPLLVKILLAFGASPALQSGEGFTPLHYAAEGGSLEVLSILLATAKGDHAGLGCLLQTSATSSGAGITPLSVAALRGDLPMARELLTRAENLPAPFGRRLKRQLLRTHSQLETRGLLGTPLEIATRHSHREMVLFLLAQGSDPLITEVEYHPLEHLHPPTAQVVAIVTR